MPKKETRFRPYSFQTISSQLNFSKLYIPKKSNKPSSFSFEQLYLNINLNYKLKDYQIFILVSFKQLHRDIMFLSFRPNIINSTHIESK